MLLIRPFYNNFMSAYSLNKFIEELIKSDDIIIIDELVDYNLEITEIVDRLSKSNDYNKAILFKNTGTNFPLLINAFGSDERMAKALQTNSLECLKDKVSEIISLYTNKPENVRQKVGMFFDLAKIRKWIPRRTTRKGECQEKVFETVDIQLLPILKCWPFDGGRFITLPCVHTVCPENGTLNIACTVCKSLTARQLACTGINIKQEQGILTSIKVGIKNACFGYVRR